MIFCPECGEEIERLRRNYSTEITIFSVDKNGEAEWKDRFDASESRGGYYCPWCYVELAETKEEAIDLLNGSPLEIKVNRALRGKIE